MEPIITAKTYLFFQNNDSFSYTIYRALTDRNIRFFTYNLDEDRELVHKYNIRSIPTIVVVENNMVIQKIENIKSTEDLKCLKT